MVSLTQDACKTFEQMFAMLSDLRKMKDEVTHNKKITVIRNLPLKHMTKAIVSNLLVYFHYGNVSDVAKLYEQTKGWSVNGLASCTFVAYKWNLRSDCEEWMRQARHHPKASQFICTHLMNVVSTWPRVRTPSHRKRKTTKKAVLPNDQPVISC